MIFTANTEILKVSGGRISSRNNLHVGCESLLKETMSEKLLISVFASLKILITCGNANFKKIL